MVTLLLVFIGLILFSCGASAGRGLVNKERFHVGIERVHPTSMKANNNNKHLTTTRDGIHDIY